MSLQQSFVPKNPQNDALVVGAFTDPNPDIVQATPNAVTARGDGFTVTLTGRGLTYADQDAPDAGGATGHLLTGGRITGYHVAEDDGFVAFRADGLDVDAAGLVSGGTEAQDVLRYLNSGDDTLVASQTYDFADLLRGNEGNDVILAGPGNDELRGGKDKDVLYGQDGDDDLRGGRGDDILDGGTGDDVLAGGPGNDTFVFLNGYGNDTVRGFEVGDADGDASGNKEPEGSLVMGPECTDTGEEGDLDGVEMADEDIDGSAEGEPQDADGMTDLAEAPANDGGSEASVPESSGEGHLKSDGPAHDVLQLPWASFKSFEEVIASAEQAGRDVVITLPYPDYGGAYAAVAGEAAMDDGGSGNAGDPGAGSPSPDQVTLIGVDLSQITADHVQLV